MILPTPLPTDPRMISVNLKKEGLGIKDLHNVKKSLVIHTAYNIANSKKNLPLRCVKIKTLPSSLLLECNSQFYKISFLVFPYAGQARAHR
jgi:hypothetical protein